MLSQVGAPGVALNREVGEPVAPGIQSSWLTDAEMTAHGTPARKT